MLAGFDKGIENSRVGEIWDLEKQVVDQIEGIITLLATEKHGEEWVVEGNEVLFVNDYDLTTFNAHIQAIQGLVREQEQLRKESIANGKQELKDTKRILAEWGT